MLNFAVLRALVYPSFVELERAEAQRNMARVIEALDNDLTFLSSINRDWSNWDDTYVFALSGDESYVEENFYTEALQDVDIPVVYIFNQDRRRLFGTVIDFANGTARDGGDFVLDHLDPGHALLTHPTPDSKQQGILFTVYGPMLFASQPILNNDGQGLIAGTMIMGRLLDEQAIENLRAQTRVDLGVKPVEAAALAADEQAIVAGLESSGDAASLREEGEDVLAAYALVRGLNDDAVLLLRAATPRRVTAMGERTLMVALSGLIIAGVVVLLVLMVLLQRSVTGPLFDLTGHVLSIGSSGDLTRRLDLRRGDEIGTLAGEFDGMLARLAEARRQLQEQSYKAGLLEMATGVLHNLRNQISPLILRLARLRDNLEDSTNQQAERALSGLAEEGLSDERKAKLLRYLRLVHQEQAADRVGALEIVALMSRQFARVESVLDDQDRFTGNSPVIEPTELPEILERAIETVPERPDRHVRFDIDPSVAALGPVLGERYVLVQIFHNLLLNAVEAIETGGVTAGRVDVQASAEATESGQRRAHIEVRDNGHGIDPGLLTRIFELGFTTKDDGKGGAGLQWCANSLARLDGRIRAQSPGRGEGAVLHLTLPLAEGAMDSAA